LSTKTETEKPEIGSDPDLNRTQERFQMTATLRESFFDPRFFQKMKGFMGRWKWWWWCWWR
jgi:hypothetical protein